MRHLAPYYCLRDYGVDGQLGAEPTPAEFIDNLVYTFHKIGVALADDGLLFVNLGDTYATRPRGNDKGWDKSRLTNPARVQKMQAAALRANGRPTFDRPEKNLLMIPARFAIAMQDDGWILRNDIIWCKPNGMPESVTDRFTRRHEHIFMFAKRPRTYFDLDAVRRPLAASSVARLAQDVESQTGTVRANGGAKTNGNFKAVGDVDAGANPGDWWEMPTRPFKGAHFATFPPELPERCILAATRPGDTVLDPFSGSGTTGMVATKHGRQYVGIDINPEYHDLALKTRLEQGVLA